MSVIWRLADQLGTVPREADAVMKAQAAQWWQLPRTFACVHARTADPWLIVWPLPSIWCGRCGVVALELLTTCSYCDGPVSAKTGENVIHEPPDGYLVFLSSAHFSCLENAR